MAIDLANFVRQFIDYGSESYEKRTTRIALQIACIAIFVLVIWKFLYRR
jgi:hypothetical protein